MSGEPGAVPDAHAWDERFRSADLIWTAEPNVFVVEHTASLPPGRVIDLAGGEGRNAVWLADRGWDAELVEFSPVALAKAARLADARGVSLTCTEADVTEPLELVPADLVVVAYLQLPAGPLARALGNATAAVRPGGTLVVVSHARQNLDGGYGGPQDPAVLATPEQLAQLAQAGGLIVESATNRRRQVVTPDGPRTAIDVVMRATRPSPEH